MSKMGNHVVGMTESEEYQFGWESAERGEPKPMWTCRDLADMDRLQTQQMGWNDYHEGERDIADTVGYAISAYDFGRKP